jgi:hypothetical protein
VLCLGLQQQVIALLLMSSIWQCRDNASSGIAWVGDSVVYICHRSKLFKMINQHPTLFEVVTGRVKLTAKPTSAGAAAGNKGLPAKRKQDGAMVSLQSFAEGSAMLTVEVPNPHR